MRENILLAAESLIIEKGYRNTSLNEIVDKAGCSKSAVYEYFGGKEGLLSALSVDLVTALSRELEMLSHTTDDVTASLESYATRAMSLILTERHMSTVRSVVAEVWHSPALGHSYYRLGPKLAQERLADYLQEQADAGLLDIKDANQAAVHFYGLMLWDKWNAMVVGGRRPLKKAEVKREAVAAVAAFMRLYGKHR